MEKSIYPDPSSRRILITGPESTGKSELATALAGHFGGAVVPEYARNYILNLGRRYEYRDVEHIALQQIKQYEDSLVTRKWVFFDTWLIITRVWFEVVYGSVPAWIDGHIRKARFDLVLLCGTDIPWVSDPVRENGGEKREMLFARYTLELDRFGFDWDLVTGKGEERKDRAITLINKKIPYVTT